MPRFTITVKIMPRPGLLDPQGQAVGHALTELGFADVTGVRVGKSLTFQLDRADRGTAERDAQTMCDRLLANPVTEDYGVTVEEAA